MLDAYSYLLDHLTQEAFIAFGQVVIIDLVLAGDNAIVIGLAAAGLAREQRVRAIVIGMGAATILRIAFALVATQLLQIVGLLFAGGLLLLWVCWKMWRELRFHQQAPNALKPLHPADSGAARPVKTLGQAVTQILIADITMSLDNVLAVAGAALEHPWVLISGLTLSIMLMGVAASYIANLLDRHRWVAYVGLAIIFYVAVDMIHRGSREFWPLVQQVVGS